MNIAMRHSRALIISLCLVTALAAGCSSSSDAPIAGATTTGGTSKTAVVHIKGYAYIPPKLDVKAGQQITFINDDKVEHTATANNKSFDTGMIAPGKSKTITVKAGVTGADSYFCTVHNYMKGTVTVGK